MKQKDIISTLTTLGATRVIAHRESDYDFTAYFPNGTPQPDFIITSLTLVEWVDYGINTAKSPICARLKRIQ